MHPDGGTEGDRVPSPLTIWRKMPDRVPGGRRGESYDEGCTTIGFAEEMAGAAVNWWIHTNSGMHKYAVWRDTEQQECSSW